MSKFNILNPRTPLDSEFRARQALDGARFSAFLTAGLHVLGGVVLLSKGLPPRLWLTHLGLALIAVLLAALVRMRPTMWAAGAILALAVLQVPFTKPALIVLNVLILLLAYQGLRGVQASRKLSAAADVF